MRIRVLAGCWIVACLATYIPGAPPEARAQSVNGAVTGTMTDGSGAVLPGVTLTLRNQATGAMATVVSGDDGAYAFRNLTPSRYTLKAQLGGFQEIERRDIAVLMSGQVRLDLTLSAGVTERVDVSGTPVLQLDTAAREGGIAPETLQKLPLLVSGGPRSSAGFAVLLPGVTTGGQGNAFNARINGGMQLGDEAVLDGVSMQQGFMSQSGMVSILTDFPLSPDMVSEVKVLTSGYDPQYGSSTGGQVMAVTKAGGSSFHGAIFEYHRNTALNATQFGADEKPKNLQNNFGANIGGPVALPMLTSDRTKSYFYFNFEGFRIKGGVNRPTLSLPSLAERNGDFRDWRDADGNLIPIYDPSTLRPNPNGPGFIKDQFMGCDGTTPNVICPNRITPIARQFLQFVPEPTSSGPLNNYLAPRPVPDTILAQSNYFLGRYDLQYRDKDHFSLSMWHQRAPAKFESVLPQQIAGETYSNPQNSWVNRFNWDRVFTQNLLNHFAMGYLNRNEGYGCVNQSFVNDLPQIPGVAANNVPPRLEFSDGFSALGCNAGVNEGNVTTRPTFIVNDLFTWVTGRHAVKFGFEYRNIGGNLHTNGGQAGTFTFGRGATGLLDVNSGNPIASLLLGAVQSGSATFRAVDSSYPRQNAYILHAGDTWRMNDRFTVNYGLRWDLFTPSSEKYDRFSFFDPVGANPGAGGRPGRLAFAGDGYGPASYGARFPEETFYKAFMPRLGATYALDRRTVIKSAYGIFYTQAFYPGWGGGISQDGFANNATFSSTAGGLAPAFLLQQGFPQNFQEPPFIQSDFRNGQGILYRPLDANERPYSHQWNVTVDREVSDQMLVSVAYVGSLGRRLPSTIAPLNALDPALLSMGATLYEEFQPGQTSVAGVPEPYPGWREQMTGCAPSVAQALLPFPQYCDPLRGLNENHGESSYHSFQAKIEKRFSAGTYLLVSYTLAKSLTSGGDSTQRDALTWSGAHGVISPFERERNKALTVDDTPQTLSLAFVYDLPLGEGRQYLDKPGVVNALAGGWQFSTVFRASSGIPFFFRSGQCNVPAQFRVGCIPAIRDGANPWAQDLANFDPAKGPLFNRDAFESVDAFNFYYGVGPRISNLRGFGYHNQDMALIKNTRILGKLNFQVRVEAFNVWNWHIFGGTGEWGNQAFNVDISSPNFGQWTGGVSNPRNIQVAGRLEF